jgi:hydrogenase-1 operon protein HyaF
MKPFSIPVVALGPGSQQEEEPLQYLSMPHTVRTFEGPSLPDADAVRSLGPARAVLRRLLDAVREAAAGRAALDLDLDPLDPDNLGLVDQVTGEGEVSARIESESGSMRIQESVFAGVWRVRVFDTDNACVADRLQIGELPPAIFRAGRSGSSAPRPLPEIPAGTASAPALLAEIAEHLRIGTPQHVINLSLLPFSPEDGSCLDQALGRGTVSLLSRGYGNCRITATGISRLWWVQYFNSQDALILNTLEITDAPAVVRAAREDLEDSAERLADVLNWIDRVHGNGP